MNLLEVVRVRFAWPGKMYEFTNPHQLPLKRGDKVVVETDRGGTLVGQVMIAPRIRLERKEDKELTSVIRLATEQDLQMASVTDEFRRDVRNYFETRLRAHNISGVKLIDVEKADGGQRLIIYFTTEQRKFSPRDFAIELGQRFKVRIDMRSVGIRDAARLSGGIGKCGLSLCCSTWIPDFEQISIRMAKDQGLSLDPDSINGQCGRLLCCLGYEHKNYLEMGKGLPKVGKMVVTPVGDARVVKLDILKGLITVRTADGIYETFTAEQVKRKFAPQAGGDEGGAAQSAHNKSNPNLASAASRPARKEEEITEESFLQQREDADSLDNDDEVL
jgi:cell fate regulator YaaT (PSP1 superfamily)